MKMKKEKREISMMEFGQTLMPLSSAGPVDIKDFTIEILDGKVSIVLKGTQWVGLVDKAVAKFIIDLDNTLQNEFKKHGIDFPIHKNGLVSLKVTDGSTDLKVVLKILKEIKNMPNAKIILIGTMALLAVSAWKTSDIIEASNSKHLNKVQSEVLMAFAEASKTITHEDSEERLKKPLMNLLSSMAKEDKISILGISDPQKASVVKKKIAQKREKKSAATYYVDLPYTVTGLLTEGVRSSWRIVLKFGDASFRAKLELQKEEVAKLLEDYRTAYDNNTQITPDLQVTVEITKEGEIRNASVIGMGKARDKSRTLGEAMKAAKSQ